jgi:hypothetical protein
VPDSLAGGVQARLGGGYRSHDDPVVWSTRAAVVADVPSSDRLAGRMPFLVALRMGTVNAFDPEA